MTRTIPDLRELSRQLEVATESAPVCSRKHGLSFGVDLQRLVADLLPREVGT